MLPVPARTAKLGRTFLLPLPDTLLLSRQEIPCCAPQGSQAPLGLLRPARGQLCPLPTTAPSCPPHNGFQLQFSQPGAAAGSDPPHRQPPAPAWHTLAPFSPLYPPTASPGQGAPFTACSPSSRGRQDGRQPAPEQTGLFRVRWGGATTGRVPARAGAGLGQGARQHVLQRAPFAQRAKPEGEPEASRGRVGKKKRGHKREEGKQEGKVFAVRKTHPQPREAAGDGETRCRVTCTALSAPAPQAGQAVPSTGLADTRPHPGTPRVGCSYSHLKPG